MTDQVLDAVVDVSPLPSTKRSPPHQPAAHPPGPKLSALTSLRFFAAAMIVMLHSQGYFGTIAALRRFTLTQGVCFFFVLSGFILTYAYPTLGRSGVARFLVARLARIVPMHLVAFLLYILILPAWYRDSVSRSTWGAGALTLTLLQAWVPIYRVQTAFNGVSWSLSAELFFYLCFPLLLWRWRQTWRIKLALTSLLVCGAILVANRGLAYLPNGAEARDIVYFHPLARVWEFTVGVATAHLWRYLRTRITCDRRLGTVLEGAVIGMTLFVMAQSGAWASHAGRLALVGAGGEAWLASSGFVCLPFAALIGVMAFEWGWIARMLARRPFVLLGEMSFSLYLLHLLVCHYYVIHPQAFVAVPPWLLYLAYWAVVLLAAYVGWAVVEVPCRHALVGLWDRQIARGAVRSGRRTGDTASQRRPRVAAAAWLTVAACGALLFSVAGPRFVTRPALPAPATVASVAPALGRAQVAIDTIGDQSATGDHATVIARHDYPSDAITVVGWSVDPVRRGPVRGILVSVDGAPGAWAEYGSGRNDVSSRFGSAEYLHSGFIGVVSLKGLANGPHTLMIRALIPGENAYTETRESFVIT